MLPSYPFGVNTVKNNKILFVNASGRPCVLRGAGGAVVGSTWSYGPGIWRDGLPSGWGLRPRSPAPALPLIVISLGALVAGWRLGRPGEAMFLQPLHTDHCPQVPGAHVEASKDWPHPVPIRSLPDDQLSFLSSLVLTVPVHRQI